MVWTAAILAGLGAFLLRGRSISLPWPEEVRGREARFQGGSDRDLFFLAVLGTGLVAALWVGPWLGLLVGAGLWGGEQGWRRLRTLRRRQRARRQWREVLSSVAEGVGGAAAPNVAAALRGTLARLGILSQTPLYPELAAVLRPVLPLLMSGLGGVPTLPFREALAELEDPVLAHDLLLLRRLALSSGTEAAHPIRLRVHLALRQEAVAGETRAEVLQIQAGLWMMLGVGAVLVLLLASRPGLRPYLSDPVGIGTVVGAFAFMGLGIALAHRASQVPFFGEELARIHLKEEERTGGEGWTS